MKKIIQLWDKKLKKRTGYKVIHYCDICNNEISGEYYQIYKVGKQKRVLLQDVCVRCGGAL